MAGINDEKFRQMQDEMSRFEEEIGLPLPDVVPLPPEKRSDGLMPPSIPPGTLMPPLPSLPPPPPGLMHHNPMAHGGIPPGGMGMGPGGMTHCPPVHLGPGPPMPPGMMPPNMGPPGMPPPGMPPPGMLPPGPPLLPGPPMFNPGPPMMAQQIPPTPPMGPPLTMPPMPPQFSSFPGNVGPPVRPPEKGSGPVVLSSTPMLYVANPQVEVTTPQVSEPVTPAKTNESNTSPATGVLEKKKKIEKPVVTVTMEPVTAQVQSKKREKKNRKLMRTAGGHTWEDSTLGEWDDDDFRLFCGDLGNDVTDEVLSRAFSKYTSFFKAKVIRDKRTNKTKGFGFVSFKDPQDFIKATKEMNGRYVGSRPIKLRKSTWKNRSLDVVRKKDKEKVALINMLTGK